MDARLVAIRSAITNARHDEAEQLLRDLIEIDGDDGQPDAATEQSARLLLGNLLLDSDRSGEALDVLAPLDTVDEYAPQQLLGLAYAQHGDHLARNGASREDVIFHHELALAYLEAQVEREPKGELKAATKALQLRLYTMGDADGALALADVALKHSPRSGELLLLRGCAGGHAYWSAAANGDAERADALWDRAVKDLHAAQEHLASSRTEPWVQLSWLGLQKESALPQALDDARQAAQRGATGALFDVAVVGVSRGENRLASEALGELVRYDKQRLIGFLTARNDTTSLVERFSYATFESGMRQDEARTIHAALSTATRESSAVWNNYALLCRDTGEYEESYRAYTIALEIGGPDARLLNDTALVLHYHLLKGDLGKASTARTLYEQAIELAEAGLASQDVAQAARVELKSALTDARNNLRLLNQSTG